MDIEVKKRFEFVISKADDLPVLPNVAMEILNLIDSENSVPADFQNIIENDQVMTLKILKLANSAYYGYPREIISLKEAIVILGLDTLKSLVLSLLTRQMLSNSLDSYGLKNGQLWEHSLAVAMIARAVSKTMKLANTEKYFVAGLLHDIGKLLLNVFLEDNTELIKRQVMEGGLDFTEAEKQIMGFDHALIGARLIEDWNLPEFLVKSIQYHHTHNLAPVSNVRDAYIIEISDKLAYKVAPGTAYEIEKKVSPNEYGKLGLTTGHVEGILDSIKASLQSLKL